MRRGLIDEYLLLIHPLVLGTGRRMFAEGVPPGDLRLAISKTTEKGVVIASYETLVSGVHEVQRANDFVLHGQDGETSIGHIADLAD